MSDHRKAVRRARDIHQRRNTFDEEQRERAIRELASHQREDDKLLWSKAQIAKITGASKATVDGLIEKHDHTGGRFNPASLDLILEEFELADRNETNRALTAKILGDGTSSYMLAKLLDQPVATVKWRASQYRKQAAA